ncbi:hypothetical protein RB653_007607 [Dictyostelium firmibasis]|uniref:Uncharacterized protein n=1 Tax=Dictyostelium firmibasis TaxID=79012 RepID=A0AAN7TVM5_9MYCE
MVSIQFFVHLKIVIGISTFFNKYSQTDPLPSSNLSILPLSSWPRTTISILFFSISLIITSLILSLVSINNL